MQWMEALTAVNMRCRKPRAADIAFQAVTRIAATTDVICSAMSIVHNVSGGHAPQPPSRTHRMTTTLPRNLLGSLPTISIMSSSQSNTSASPWGWGGAEGRGTAGTGRGEGQRSARRRVAYEPAGSSSTAPCLKPA